jgi:hypothetical protein
MFAQSRDIPDIGKLEQFAASDDQFRRADYATIIANWRRFIPEDRFLVIFLDDIEKTPETVLSNVCDFLGVEYPDKAFAKAGRPVHVGEEREIPPSVGAWMAQHYG